MSRALAIAGFAVGLFGLILQFAVTIPASMEAGRSLPGSIVFYFSFFTILTNIAAVLIYAAALGGRPAFFARPRVRTGVAVAIAVVSIVYATILAKLWQPQGLFFVADITLHYATPAVFVIWWLGFGRSGASRLADVPSWLVYPVLYLVYAMARGAIVAQYPYPFLDIGANGVASVIEASLMMLGLFVVVALVAVLVDRMMPVGRASGEPR